MAEFASGNYEHTFGKYLKGQQQRLGLNDAQLDRLWTKILERGGDNFRSQLFIDTQIDININILAALSKLADGDTAEMWKMIISISDAVRVQNNLNGDWVAEKEIDLWAIAQEIIAEDQ